MDLIEIYNYIKKYKKYLSWNIILWNVSKSIIIIYFINLLEWYLL